MVRVRVMTVVSDGRPESYQNTGGLFNEDL